MVCHPNVPIYISLFIIHSFNYPNNDSIQPSCSVVSDSLWPHGLQHARPPCPSPTPGVYSNSCPLSQWCHPTISSSVSCFSSRLQSFPASGSSPMNQFFASGGQNIGASASAYSGLISFKIDWLDLLVLQGTLKSLLQHHRISINSSALSFLHSPTLTSIHDCIYWMVILGVRISGFGA